MVPVNPRSSRRGLGSSGRHQDPSWSLVWTHLPSAGAPLRTSGTSHSSPVSTENSRSQTTSISQHPFGWGSIAAWRRAGWPNCASPWKSRSLESSGGQQAQVSLALALATRAPVLLLDEPLASLDPLARREFLEVLQSAARTAGQTVVMSSHVVTDIAQACDEIVVLGNGMKLLDDSIVEAVRRHGVMHEGHGSTEGVPVGSFPDGNGRLLTLVERPSIELRSMREATLEEVVLGYLSAGRSVLSVS